MKKIQAEWTKMQNNRYIAKAVVNGQEIYATAKTKKRLELNIKSSYYYKTQRPTKEIELKARQNPDMKINTEQMTRMMLQKINIEQKETKKKEERQIDIPIAIMAIAILIHGLITKDLAPAYLTIILAAAGKYLIRK